MGSGTVAAAAPGDRCMRRAREEAVALLSGGGGARRRQQLQFLPQLQLQQLGKLVVRKIRTLTNPREISGEDSKAWAGRRGGGGRFLGSSAQISCTRKAYQNGAGALRAFCEGRK